MNKEKNNESEKKHENFSYQLWKFVFEISAY